MSNKWYIAATVLALLAVMAAGGLLVGLVVLARAPEPQPTPVGYPAILVQPAQGRPGTSVTVSGSGWQPGESLLIGLDDPIQEGEARAILASATAGPDGRFSGAFLFPDSPFWATLPQVLVVVWSPQTGAAAFAPFLPLTDAATATPSPTATATPSPSPTVVPTEPPATATPLPPTPTATRTPLPPTPTPTPFPAGWRGEYFPRPDLVGAPVLVRDDALIAFDWGRNPPAAGLPADGFSVRWTRTMSFDQGVYRFRITVDDGVRLYVDGALVIDAWRDGARREVTGERTLAAGNHNLRLEYYERGGDALIYLQWEKVSAYPDWKGEYWPNRDLSGNPALVRNDPWIDFNWGGGGPAAGLPTDNFSARWTRMARFDAGTYRFHATVDDGVRLWVDDRLVIDAWRDGSAREVVGELSLARASHSVRVEMYEHTGNARIIVWWEKVASPSYPDWRGEYWSNRNLSGSPALVRNDRAVNFHWNNGSPAAGLPADNFSTRWSRRLNFRAGLYRLYAWADDGVRVMVDGRQVLDEWHDNSADEVYMVDLPLRGEHQVVVEYYEHGGEALVQFWWQQVGAYPTPTPVPPTHTPTPTATPTPTVTPGPNHPPVAVDDAATTQADQPVVVNVLANDSDPDGDPLTVISADASSAHGGAVACTAAGLCTYTPPSGYVGSDTFTYVAGDGRGGADAALVTVTVNLSLPDVRLSELLSHPAAVDWDGDGTADETDEWIELVNVGGAAASLDGWRLDVGQGSVVSYTLPVATIIQPGGCLLFFRRTTSLVLDDNGGTVRLLRPDGTVADTVTFGALAPDASMSRDAAGVWHTDWPPSPGLPNTG